MPIKKSKTGVISITTIEDAAEAQRRIGELLRTVQTLENEFERERQTIDVREDEAVHPLHTEALALAKGIFTYAQSHRDELTQNRKKKSVQLPGKAGTLQWYTPPASIDLENTAQVLNRIRERGLRQFIRVREEINKEAMLSEQHLASSISGVRILKQEKFSIKPSGTKEKMECKVETRRFRFVPKS